VEYFLTGGTGFVGGHLADQLLEDGHDVVALARSPSDDAARALADAGATVVEGDITDPGTLREPMREVDGVFHVAGWYDIAPDDPTLGDRINVDGTRNVLETMRDLGIEKGVYTSTLAVKSDTHGQVVDESYRYDGPHLTEYDRTKWEAHYEVAEPLVAEGLPLVTVMPGVVYGPDDPSAFGRAIRDFLRGDLPMIPRGVAYSPGHVADVARAHVLAMEHGTPGEEYIVGGDPATLVDLFDVVADAAGRDPPRAVSPRVFGALAKASELLERFVSLPKDYRAESLRVLAGVTYLGDNTRATTELGLEHRPLREGLAATVEHELDALDA
jgi:nucleoside-diphosphate-sugar epimerase